MRQFVVMLFGVPFYLYSLFFKFKNRHMDKVLIFTDSRGLEISKLFNRRNPFASYIGSLIKKYNVDYVMMPEKHTTIIDFLYFFNNCKQQKKYDKVIIHLGIVDYSPRPISMVKHIRAVKNYKVMQIFNQSFDYIDPVVISNDTYNGESVSYIYSKSFLANHILPMLSNIDNLIYVGVNPIVPDWNGNYSKARPSNMNIVLEYDAQVTCKIKKCVKLSDWTHEQIMKFTVDNIHFSSEGFIFLTNKLLRIVGDK